MKFLLSKTTEDANSFKFYRFKNNHPYIYIIDVELETAVRPLPMIAKIQKERLKAGRMVFLCLKCKVHCGY